MQKTAIIQACILLPKWDYIIIKPFKNHIRTVTKAYVNSYKPIWACVSFVDDQIGVVMDALNNSRFRGQYDCLCLLPITDGKWEKKGLSI